MCSALRIMIVASHTLYRAGAGIFFLCTVHCLIYLILFSLFASFEKHCYISGLSLSDSLLLLFQVLCSYVYLYRLKANKISIYLSIYMSHNVQCIANYDRC